MYPRQLGDERTAIVATLFDEARVEVFVRLSADRYREAQGWLTILFNSIQWHDD